MADDRLLYSMCMQAIVAISKRKGLNNVLVIDGDNRFHVRKGLEIGRALPGDILDAENKEIVATAFKVVGATRPNWNIATCCTILLRALEPKEPTTE